MLMLRQCRKYRISIGVAGKGVHLSFSYHVTENFEGANGRLQYTNADGTKNAVNSLLALYFDFAVLLCSASKTYAVIGPNDFRKRCKENMFQKQNMVVNST